MPQTPEQERILARALKAAQTMAEMAIEAHDANLPILAGEYNYMANELRLKVGLQRRALESPLFEER